MGHAQPKQYLPLAGQPLIWHALAALCATPKIALVFVVLAADDAHWPEAAMAALGPRLRVLRCGGDTRAQSVLNGLRAMAVELDGIADDWILVHDAARPCLSVALVEKLMAEVGDDAAGGLLAVPVADTLKRADEDLRSVSGVQGRSASGVQSRSVATVPREGLWQAQTPQMFRHGLLLAALDQAGKLQPVTDEAGAIEALGLAPRLVMSDVTNLKVTYPSDLQLAARILHNREIV